MKKLIVNPTTEQLAGLKLLNPGDLFNHILDKVFLAKDGFKPQNVRTSQVAKFISNVEHRLVGTQLYAGYDINTREEAAAYLNRIGDEIYGKGWITKVVASEVHLTNGQNTFGIYASNPDTIESLQKELREVAQVEVNASAEAIENQQKSKKKPKNV